MPFIFFLRANRRRHTSSYRYSGLDAHAKNPLCPHLPLEYMQFIYNVCAFFISFIVIIVFARRQSTVNTTKLNPIPGKSFTVLIMLDASVFAEKWLWWICAVTGDGILLSMCIGHIYLVCYLSVLFYCLHFVVVTSDAVFHFIYRNRSVFGNRCHWASAQLDRLQL